MCKNCNEDKNQVKLSSTGKDLNYFLDRADHYLQESWRYDVSQELRPYVLQLIEIFNSLKKPYPQVSFEVKAKRLMESTSIIIKEIECKYCKQFEYWDMVVPIQICIYLTGEQYSKAFKLMIERDFKMRYWLLQAIYHKVIKNKLSLWSERLRWYIFKSNHKLNVQNVVN